MEYTYQVTIGSSASITHDVVIVRAKSCAQAEKKALEYADDKDLHVTKIEEIVGTYIE